VVGAEPTREMAPDAPALPDLERYARQIALPGFGLATQRRLERARLLIVGAGGLGSPAALYLAAAGVGHLTIVDGDRVEPSNLHRQILHTTARVGVDKVESAAIALRALNPQVTVHAVRETVTASTADALVRGHDVVVDGTDNFAARYAIADACVRAGIPYVYASVQRWDGQLSVFHPPRGPCYRCLFPTPPAPGEVPTCAEAGVIGAAPGLLGAWQALEALKLLGGLGTPLIGQLLLLDLASGQVRTIAVPRRTTCTTCGDAADRVSPPTPSASTTMLDTHSPSDVRSARTARPDIVLLDVREPNEFAAARIEGATLMPLRTLPARVHELARDAEIIVYCHHGVRSEMAGQYLLQQGFTNVAHMAGGIDRWSVEVDATVPRY
jgi:sulfur-carrier protein adenylyltransferase/sulfurtransferase